jgi:hypothetical protein
MQLPTLPQALAAIDNLRDLGEAASSAASIVNVLVGLFSDPADQEALKSRYAEAMGNTDAALARLEAAARDAAQA